MSEHVVIGGKGFVDPVKARNDAREKFIAIRTRREQTFDQWLKGWLKCPEDVRNMISYDFSNSTFKSEVPEFYADVPNPTVCKEQLDTLNGKIMEVNELIDKLNREGLKRLEEYNNM